jgi:ATP-dependent DNA helicase RecG
MTEWSSACSVPSTEQIDEWVGQTEGEHFEFKEAKQRYSLDDLAKYLCALANEGGGRVILGVTNSRPRQIVGTQAFSQIEDARRALVEKLPLRIEVAEVAHPRGRVLVFKAPPRPIGVPLKVDRVYWAREADSLVPMSEARLRAVFDEAGRDFSAEICPAASVEDLDPSAINEFRRRWVEKSGNQALVTLSPEQLLRDAEVLSDEGLTYAGLILFGSRAALGRLAAQAEIVFEYRSSEAAGPAQQRKEYRQGFFSVYEDLWATINLRNDVQHYQDGLFVLDVPTFDERSVREAVLNAVSHRDYRLGGSIFIRQYARRLVVESPGGLPLGVTPENVLDRQSPRNRRIADVLLKCGLVERSGQGMNLMFEHSISQGKLRPDLLGTDAYQVVLTLHGEVNDPRFIQFLETVGREASTSFGTRDLLVLDLVHREQPVPAVLEPHLRRLTGVGAVERVGRGRGVRYLLSRRFYLMTGRTGAYTRRRGLDRDTHEELLLKHLRESPAGCALAELCEVLPELGRRQVQALLEELRREGRATVAGTRRWARWRAAPAQSPV